jgi:dihydroorotase
MNPPLRSEADRRAIIDGLRDGTIDTIATDHAPHTVDDKHVEFNNAKFGIVGLETAVMLTMEVLVNKEGFSYEQVAKLWSQAPANILGVHGGDVKVGAIADLTIIDPKYVWTVEPNRFYSKSKNTPFSGYEGKGAAVMTVVNGQIKWESKHGR